MAWQTGGDALLEAKLVPIGDGIEFAAYLKLLADEIERGVTVVERAPAQIGPALDMGGSMMCLCLLSPARLAAAQTRHRLLSTLTSRQWEILAELMKGHTAKGIATMLGIHPRTVEAHVHHIHKKAGTHRTIELMEIAFSQLD